MLVAGWSPRASVRGGCQVPRERERRHLERRLQKSLEVTRARGADRVDAFAQRVQEACKSVPKEGTVYPRWISVSPPAH